MYHGPIYIGSQRESVRSLPNGKRWQERERHHHRLRSSNDSLFPQFTVYETLMFASKMKNKGADHLYEANKVIKALNLESCADLKITGCSGGQCRRVSIGVELISGPDILVLDEPTSGLDSTNAVIIINLLRNLAKETPDGPIIVTTIHQPNQKIFNLFDQVYLLSRVGHKIYSGSPGGIIQHFNRIADLKQSEYSSPADYALKWLRVILDFKFSIFLKRSPKQKHPRTNHSICTETRKLFLSRK